MKKSTKLVALGAALILSGILVTTLSLSSQVSAQGSTVDVEKWKHILNETRMAIEANDDPGALTQLDLAEGVLSGGSNMTTESNMTEAIVTGWLPIYCFKYLLFYEIINPGQFLLVISWQNWTTTLP